VENTRTTGSVGVGGTNEAGKQEEKDVRKHGLVSCGTPESVSFYSVCREYNLMRELCSLQDCMRGRNIVKLTCSERIGVENLAFGARRALIGRE